MDDFNENYKEWINDEEGQVFKLTEYLSIKY